MLLSATDPRDRAVAAVGGGGRDGRAIGEMEEIATLTATPRLIPRLRAGPTCCPPKRNSVHFEKPGNAQRKSLETPHIE